MTIPSEHDEQAVFYQDTLLEYRLRDDFIPELFFAVVNGFYLSGKGKWGLLKKYKAEGWRSGIADIQYQQPRGSHPFCVIEMKRSDLRGDKKGGLEKEQVEYLNAARRVGAYVCVCYSADEAKEAFADYMKLNYMEIEAA
jgi:hypothetical protein